MPRSHRSILRALLPMAALALGVLLAIPAQAQTVEVLPNTLERSSGIREVGERREWVSHADCLADDVFSIDVNLTNFGSFDLEVWASTGEDCSLKDEREGTTASCWKLNEFDPSDGSTGTTDVTFKSRDIVGKKVGQEPGSSGIDVCDDETDNQQISIWFILVDNSNNAQGQTSWASGIDMLGPPPPTGLSAGLGENRLIVDWDDIDNEEDLRGYRVYCDPPPGGASAPSNSPNAVDGGPDSGDAAVSDASTGDATVTTEGGTDAATDGGGGSSGAGGSGGGTGNPECPSSLVSGTRPDPAYRCGSVDGQFVSSIDAEGLVNGTTYAVAVAAVDVVGNSGVLSEVVCGTPQPVDDFFELYRRAGGKGGGGYCQITAEPVTGFAAVLLTALAAFGIRRRLKR